MQKQCYGYVPTELLPSFSDKPSVPRSDSATSAAPGALSAPESSVNTAGQQLVNSLCAKPNNQVFFCSEDQGTLAARKCVFGIDINLKHYN